jgi:restriction system protein
MSDVLNEICQHFQLSEEEMAERLPSGKQTIIKNRVGWARTFMGKAGLLSMPGRALIQITERGHSALQQCPDRVTVRYLKQYPEFVAFQTAKPAEEQPGAQQETPQEESATTATPDEQIAQAYQSMLDALTDELMQTIQDATPAFFEQLVVDLMIAIGYGGSRKEAGKATKATGDDGIDGIIKEDKLGLDTIYLQAKRWKNTVHRPEIDKFIGALTRQRARKGVFITTSEFSDGAREAASGLDMKIVLLDGRELARLMIEHGLGVTTKEVYAIKQLDTDYFNED